MAWVLNRAGSYTPTDYSSGISQSLSMSLCQGGLHRQRDAVQQTGKPIRANIPSRGVRRASESDAAACNTLCRKVHGFDREHEVAHAIARGTAAVVESNGRITGYTTGVGFVGHGVGETNEDLKALIASADGFSGPGILIPTGNGELFRWCLDNGLKVVQQMTLMDAPPSGPANGVYWPAVLS